MIRVRRLEMTRVSHVIYHLYEVHNATFDNKIIFYNTHFFSAKPKTKPVMFACTPERLNFKAICC